MEFEKPLINAIETQLEELDKLEVGTEKHQQAVEATAKLMDRAIEIERLEVEKEEHEQTRREESKDRWIRNIIAGAGIILPLGVTIWGTIKSLKFEETGTVTTMAGRGFFNKILSRK